jgi:hypothetical protein
MHIVIETDGAKATVKIAQRDDAGTVEGGEVTATTTQGGNTETASPQAATLEARDAGPAPAVGEAATTAQGSGTETPQAAALGDRDAGPVPTIAELTPGVPPLPLATPGPDAPATGSGGELSAGAAPGIPLEPPPVVRNEDDATEGDQ